MKSKLSIQLKAALLLIVFGLNTMIGFACALGVDMGFNSTHHHDEEATEIHVHKDGKKHEHKKTSTSTNHQHGKEDGGCCNDTVIKISQTDKSVPQSGSIISPFFCTSFIASYYNIDIFHPAQGSPNTRYFFRSYHPPIPDIRIAIQSFQI